MGTAFVPLGVREGKGFLSRNLGLDICQDDFYSLYEANYYEIDWLHTSNTGLIRLGW